MVRGEKGEAAPRDALTVPLLLVLALLAASSAFSTDLYLPALPDMATDLEADPAGVQLSLSGFLIGVAAGQLVWGPLSDRVGRRLPLLIGTAIMVAASVVVVLAPNVTVLVLARVVQGLSAAAGRAIAPAIVADIAKGREAARAITLMMVIVGIAPVVAPVVGGMLTGPLGWRGVLAVVLGIAGLMLLSVLFAIRETRPAGARITGREERGIVRRELLSRPYLGVAFAYALGFGSMMAYISASPFLYQGMMGLGEVTYGMLFALNAAGMMTTSFVSARLVRRIPPRRLMGTGLTVILSGSIAVFVLSLTPVHPGWIAVPLFFLMSAAGLTMGNGTALALAAAPRASGTASAVLGALQFGIGAAVAPLVTIAGEHTAVPLAVVMLGCATLAMTGFLIAGRPAPR